MRSHKVITAEVGLVSTTDCAAVLDIVNDPPVSVPEMLKTLARILAVRAVVLNTQLAYSCEFVFMPYQTSTALANAGVPNVLKLQTVMVTRQLVHCRR